MHSEAGTRFLAASEDIARWLGRPLSLDGNSPIHVLAVGHSDEFLRAIQAIIDSAEGICYAVDVEDDSREASSLIMCRKHDVYVLDYVLSHGQTCKDIVNECHTKGRHFPFIVVSSMDVDKRPLMGIDCMGWFNKQDTMVPEALDSELRFLYKKWATRCHTCGGELSAY